MLHGRVVRPPGINAKLVSVDGFPKKIPDLVKVVVQKDFVGVVARSEIGAIRAAETLKVTWNDPGGAPKSHDELYAQMQTQPAQSRLLASDGSVDKALAGAAKVLEATYYYPYQLHGSMGPSCAIADVKADEATVWSPTQGVYPLRAAVARVLGFRDQQVHVIYKEGSGCYGLNGADTASVDAALLSKAVGAPGARAVDALGRACLGALRQPDGHEGEGRARRRRRSDRLGLREHLRLVAAVARATSARRTCRRAP